MISEDRAIEADLFAELGLLKSDNIFLKQIQTPEYEVHQQLFMTIFPIMQASQ